MKAMQLLFLLFLGIFRNVSAYNLLASLDQLSTEKVYDYVIVGGGTAVLYHISDAVVFVG
jgi:hypothetical protein